MECYLHIEGVNLDAVLFDTPQLSVTRGASFLLRQLTQDLPRLLKEKLAIQLEEISIGASVGLYSFHCDTPNILETLPSQIRELLKADSDYQYFTFVISTIASNGPNAFLSDIDLLKKNNRYQQMQMPSLSLAALAISSTEPCSFNGILPAQAETKAGNDQSLVSPSVKQRYEQGRDLRQHFYKQEAGEAFSEEDGYRFTNTLENLSNDPSKNNLNNKVAIIYMDGNKFGKLQRETCQTKEAIKAFDTIVQDYRSKYLANFLEAIKHNPDYHYQDGDTQRLRLEILMWGGDEILLVVPAWCGIHALSFFFEQSQTWEFKENPLTHAAGIVFANHKTPIERLKHLAKELAEEVKTASKEQTYNGFDYLVLESLNCPTSELSVVRNQVFGDQVAQARTLLAPIPLTTLSEVEQAKSIAKTQLYKIAHAILDETNALEEASMDLGKKALLAIKRMKQVAASSEAADNAEQQIKELFQPFDTKTTSEQSIWPWLHSTELWDYLVPSATSTEKEVV